MPDSQPPERSLGQQRLGVLDAYLLAAAGHRAERDAILARLTE
jgi:hypothetical protein